MKYYGITANIDNCDFILYILKNKHPDFDFNENNYHWKKRGHEKNSFFIFLVEEKRIRLIDFSDLSYTLSVIKRNFKLTEIIDGKLLIRQNNLNNILNLI